MNIGLTCILSSFLGLYNIGQTNMTKINKRNGISDVFNPNLFLMVLGQLSYNIGSVLQNVIGRERQHSADAISVALTGNCSLIRALEKIAWRTDNTIPHKP
eukprot:UN23587